MLWSRICPSGEQFFVRLACFPSIESQAWNQKILNAKIAKNSFGMVFSICVSSISKYSPIVNGKIKPHKVITLGARVMGRRLVILLKIGS